MQKECDKCGCWNCKFFTRGDGKIYVLVDPDLLVKYQKTYIEYAKFYDIPLDSSHFDHLVESALGSDLHAMEFDMYGWKEGVDK